jgi:hypothetical protein
MNYLDYLKADRAKDNEIVRLRLAVDLLRADLDSANKAIGSMFGGFSND